MGEPGNRRLGDRYELVSLLAAGGMGQVWRGRDTLLGRPVAVKVLRSEYTGDPTFVARFRAEAQHTALLAHRNIAALYDYGEVPPAEGGGEHLAYLVMELVEGEPLSALLARERPLDLARTLEILRQTAAALGAAHGAGVVHRDVKPGNVLVGVDGVVKITDFGVAWSASDVPLTQTGQVVGTAQYLSPEQACGGKAGPASDVYSLGLIGYECLAGHRAFDGGNAVQIALRQVREEPGPLPPDVPEAVRTLIGRALLKDPAARFPDGAAFAAAVADVQAGRPLPPLAAPGPPTLSLGLGKASAAGPRRRRARVLTPVAALLAGALIGAGGLQALRGPDSAAPAVAARPPASDIAPAGIVLAAAEWVGRPVHDVTAGLAALGLRVRPAPQLTAAAPAGAVTAVGPVGTLAAGDLVTVTYAVAPVQVVAPARPAPRTAVAHASARPPAATSAPPAPAAPAVAAAPTGTADDRGDPAADAGDSGRRDDSGHGRHRDGDHESAGDDSWDDDSAGDDSAGDDGDYDADDSSAHDSADSAHDSGDSDGGDDRAYADAGRNENGHARTAHRDEHASWG